MNLRCLIILISMSFIVACSNEQPSLQKSASPKNHPATANASELKDTSRIYFTGRAVPGANIFSVNLQHQLQRHTYNTGGREIDFTLDKQGNLFFTSSRVLPEDREARLELGKYGRRRQDLNVFYLPNGEYEEKLKHIAQAIEKSSQPELRAQVSRDGKFYSFVRTVLPANPYDEDAESTDELYVKHGLTGEAKKIFSTNIIINPQWSHDNKKLLFASHNLDKNKIQLILYDTASQSNTVLLENPWGANQIDSPQWLPGDDKISLILHPVERKQLRTLYLLDIQSKALQVISKANHSVQSPISWSADGTQALYAAVIDTEQDLSVLDIRADMDVTMHIFLQSLGADPKQLTQEDKAFVTWPVFSPDHQKIAYKYNKELRARTSELRVMDLNGKLLDTLSENVQPGSHVIWQ